MRLLSVILIALGIVGMIVWPTGSSAGTEIVLKNGRTIMADSCRNSNGRLLCEKNGGSFALDKRDIADVKERTRKIYDGSPEPAEAVPDDKHAEDEKHAGKAEKAGLAEQKMRLEAITKRKEALIAEREQLIHQRTALHNEYNSQRDLLGPEVLESYQSRFDELDAKIARFNEEVRALNKEEQGLLNP